MATPKKVQYKDYAEYLKSPEVKAEYSQNEPIPSRDADGNLYFLNEITIRINCCCGMFDNDKEIKEGKE